MINKVILLVACLAISKVYADEIYFSPAKFSQYRRSDIQVNKEPAPIYEPDAETEVQSKIQQPAYFKPLNVPLSNLQNYEASTNPITTSQFVHRPIYNTVYTQQPLISSKIPNQVKVIQPVYRNMPIVQNQAVKTTIAHSEAPAVSHTTFTGLGVTYSW